MKLGETVIYPGLDGVSCVGVSLCILCVPGGFGGRAGSKVSRDCIFSWDVLSGTPLDGGRAGARLTTARVRCKLGLLLHAMAVTTLSGQSQGLSSWTCSTEGRTKAQGTEAGVWCKPWLLPRFSVITTLVGSGAGARAWCSLGGQTEHLAVFS